MRVLVFLKCHVCCFHVELLLNLLQLQSIGIIANASDIVYYTSIIDELLKLYIKLGDKIALQVCHL